MIASPMLIARGANPKVLSLCKKSQMGGIPPSRLATYNSAAGILLRQY
jgi:hypothetical protein